MRTPVDPTTTEAWRTLGALKDGLEPDLRGWFAADPARAQRLTFEAADLHVDLSKNLIDDDVVAALLQLAEEVGLAERREAMFTGSASMSRRTAPCCTLRCGTPPARN